MLTFVYATIRCGFERFIYTTKESVMNEDILIDLGEVSEETKGQGTKEFEGAEADKLID